MKAGDLAGKRWPSYIILKGWYKYMSPKEQKRASERMKLLSEDARAATAMGLTYGKYKALHYTTPAETQPQNPLFRKPKKKHQMIFDLWQQGKTDAEIAVAVGLARPTIQKWRSTMEIPPANKCKISREEYTLIETDYGPFVVLKKDLL